MLNKLTVRLKIYEDESVSSYIFRVCVENGLNYLSFWNMIKKNNDDYPQFSEMNILDIAPLGHIDSDVYKLVTGDTRNSLFNNSFIKVIEKFYTRDKAERARVISGMFNYDFCYCPLCLKEKTYNRLIWRIKDIKICDQHNVRLLNKCLYCNNSIKYEELRELGVCPHCGRSLKFEINTEIHDIKFLDEQKYLYETWNTLFYAKYNNVNPKDIPYKILYILNKKNDDFNRKEVEVLIKGKNKLAMILQYAKETSSPNRVLNLMSIIRILFINGVSMQQFLNMHVSCTFISSVNANNMKKIDSARCIAPWCKNFNQTGNLIKTGTSLKKHVCGEHLLYYMFCPECGCEYAYDKFGNIHERTNFIESFYLLKKYWTSEISLEKLFYSSGLSEDKLKRLLAYFNLKNQFLKNDVGYEMDNNLLELFLVGIKKNITLKEISKWACFGNYRNFLYYRYHKSVMYELNTKEVKRNKRVDVDINKMKIHKCVDKLYENNIKITLSEVGRTLEISRETVKNWDCNEYIFKMKKQQKQLIIENNRVLLYKKVDKYLEIHKNNFIKTKDLYTHLGIVRNILWREYPDITAYATSKIKSHNKIVDNYIVINN